MLKWFKAYRELTDTVEKLRREYTDLKNDYFRMQDDKIRFWNNLNDRLILLEPSRGINGEIGALARIAILESRITSLEARC